MPRSESTELTNEIQCVYLRDVCIDYTIKRAVDAWFKKTGAPIDQYWDEDLGFTITDDGLLPLNRLDNMMAGGFDLPPVTLYKSGSKYKFSNGRHRLARLLILSNCNPDYKLNSASEYVIEKNPGPPKPQKQKPRKEKTGLKHLEGQLAVKVATHRMTATYLRGRDSLYDDVRALARFNQWVQVNQELIDPSEQFVCTICGHVAFELCEHRIKPQEIEENDEADAAVLPVQQDLRHHHWSFKPISAVKKAFRMPAFDTHSHLDDRLHGFSNSHLNEDLILCDLHAYLLMNMQTSYKVNNADNRALRLAHCHKLAQRWIILNELEQQVENLHYGFRVRFTIQRACDNMQNDMVYEQRTPARNFGLAWLPGSRQKQFLFVVALLILAYHLPLVISLVYRMCQIIHISVQIFLSILTYLGATVPDMTTRIFVSASNHQSGSKHAFQCVSTEYTTRWSEPTDAPFATQSCSFMDWVMAGLTELSLNTEETLLYASIRTSQHKEEQCHYYATQAATIRLIWASPLLDTLIMQGHITIYHLSSLAFWGLIYDILALIYHC